MNLINCMHEESDSGTSPILGPFSGPWSGSEQWTQARPCTSPVLGLFSGPWVGVEQLKKVYRGTSTVVDGPGCMRVSSQCSLQDNPYDTTFIRLGRPWVMPWETPFLEEDFDDISPMGTTKESQVLRDRSLRGLANAQRDGSQNADAPMIFSKMSRARRLIRCKGRRIAFKTSNVPQPWRAEIYCARSVSTCRS